MLGIHEIEAELYGVPAYRNNLVSMKESAIRNLVNYIIGQEDIPKGILSRTNYILECEKKIEVHDALVNRVRIIEKEIRPPTIIEAMLPKPQPRRTRWWRK